MHNQSNTQSILATHFGMLHEHASITSKGLNSEQATNIIFSNERDFMAMRESADRSSCCNADIAVDGQLIACTNCGESWTKV